MHLAYYGHHAKCTLLYCRAQSKIIIDKIKTTVAQVQVQLCSGRRAAVLAHEVKAHKLAAAPTVPNDNTCLIPGNELIMLGTYQGKNSGALNSVCVAVRTAKWHAQSMKRTGFAEK